MRPTLDIMPARYSGSSEQSGRSGSSSFNSPRRSRGLRRSSDATSIPPQRLKSASPIRQDSGSRNPVPAPTGSPTHSPNPPRHRPGLLLFLSQHDHFHGRAVSRPRRHCLKSRVEAGHHPAPRARDVTRSTHTILGAGARTNASRGGTAGVRAHGKGYLPLEEGGISWMLPSTARSVY